jgi:hypothetical protein
MRPCVNANQSKSPDCLRQGNIERNDKNQVKYHGEAHRDTDREPYRTAIQCDDEKYREDDETEGKPDFTEKRDGNHHGEPTGQRSNRRIPGLR